MQDLYLQLGINPDASAEEIDAAIRKKPQLTAASEILLNPQRRAAYQRTVLTLRSIGTLRHRLGLDNDSSWFLDTCADFAPRLQSRRNVASAPGAESAPVTATAGVGQSSAASAAAAPAKTTPPSRSWVKLLLIAAGVVALLALLYVSL